MREREREKEDEEEESTNIVNYHFSVHMLKHTERDTVTTVVVSNIIDVALPKECNA